MNRKAKGLYTETMGHGPDVVLVHGWGMHSGVWEDFAECLASSLKVTLVDLPGHGHSASVADFSLQGVSEALLDIAPAKAHWLGWSLGALLVLSLAHHYAERVESLTLVAGSARFVAADDWPGVEPSALDQFAADLEKNYLVTIRRFIALQTLGMENARSVSKQLDACLMECHPPEKAALQGGLHLLKSVDLRKVVPHLARSSLFIFGGRDKLAPKSQGQVMQALVPRSEVHILESAAHLPFISHPQEMASLITEFIYRHDCG